MQARIKKIEVPRPSWQAGRGSHKLIQIGKNRVKDRLRIEFKVISVSGFLRRVGFLSATVGGFIHSRVSSTTTRDRHFGRAS